MPLKDILKRALLISALCAMPLCAMDTELTRNLKKMQKENSYAALATYFKQETRAQTLHSPAMVTRIIKQTDAIIDALQDPDVYFDRQKLKKATDSVKRSKREALNFDIKKHVSKSAEGQDFVQKTNAAQLNAYNHRDDSFYRIMHEANTRLDQLGKNFFSPDEALKSECKTERKMRANSLKVSGIEKLAESGAWFGVAGMSAWWLYRSGLPTQADTKALIFGGLVAATAFAGFRAHTDLKRGCTRLYFGYHFDEYLLKQKQFYTKLKSTFARIERNR